MTTEKAVGNAAFTGVIVCCLHFENERASVDNTRVVGNSNPTPRNVVIYCFRLQYNHCSDNIFVKMYRKRNIFLYTPPLHAYGEKRFADAFTDVLLIFQMTDCSSEDASRVEEKEVRDTEKTSVMTTHGQDGSAT